MDVFFVISGYLITSIILADLDRGRFSLVHFYERRARRVLPALFLVLAVTAPLAWMILSPRALRAFSSSLVAVAAFTSNLHFLRQTGYFDTANELKPLLHTWSLAVEEQYYILFPLILLVSWRFGRRMVGRLLVALFVASLGAGLLMARTDPSAAFYLLPTRAWEIMIGAFAALHFARAAPSSFSPRLKGFLGAVGLAAIAFAVVGFDERTPWPSLYALVPTVGALLIILCAEEGTWTQRVLSNRIGVGIGLVSYSAYLWHQPLMSLVRYRSPTTPSPLVMGALSVVSLGLAYLSWRFVETPFRRRDGFRRATIFKLAALASAVTIVVGISGKAVAKDATEVVVGSSRIPIPVTFEGLEQGGRPCSFPSFTSGTVCRLPGTQPAPGRVLVVIGDSHARALTEAVAERTDLYTTFIDLSASGCPFLIGLPVFVGGDSHKCTAEYQRQRLAFLQGLPRDNLVVVIAARWPLYLDGRGFDNTVGGVEPTRDILATDDPGKPQARRAAEFDRALDTTMAELSALATTVIVVLPGQANGWDPIERALQLSGAVANLDALFDALEIPLAPVAAWVGPVDRVLRSESARYPNVVVVDPLPLTCTAEEQVCAGGRNGEFYFSDSDHLTLPINRRVVDEIAVALKGTGPR